MDNPLVSVICLCHNHECYVERAIASVLHQSYQDIELIVVDDTSSDGSRNIIKKLSEIHGFKTLFTEENIGNCKAFNQGLNLSRGKYIIDLAADDLLMPNRVSEGVLSLETRGEDYAVDFCDVELVDDNRQSTTTHYKRDSHGKLMDLVPDGNIYATLVERYFISAPAMMMRRSVLEELGGYDENLSYEDFDFWVRSARNHKYTFTDKVLVRKHILCNSLSSFQYKRKNRHCLSTAIVCEKIFQMNQSAMENTALLKRVRHELKWALVTENWKAAGKFMDLKQKLTNKNFSDWLTRQVINIKPPWYYLWKLVLWPESYFKK